MPRRATTWRMVMPPLPVRASPTVIVANALLNRVALVLPCAVGCAFACEEPPIAMFAPIAPKLMAATKTARSSGPPMKMPKMTMARFASPFAFGGAGGEARG